MLFPDLPKATPEDITRAYNQDGTKVDPLTLSASKRFKVPYENVTLRQRNYEKQFMHVFKYGMGPNLMKAAFAEYMRART